MSNSCLSLLLVASMSRVLVSPAENTSVVIVPKGQVWSPATPADLCQVHCGTKYFLRGSCLLSHVCGRGLKRKKVGRETNTRICFSLKYSIFLNGEKASKLFFFNLIPNLIWF